MKTSLHKLDAILACLVVLAFFPFNLLAQTGPPNSWSSGTSWYCNDGYRKTGNQCIKFEVPDNAWVSGASWYCNDGYKKKGLRCEKFVIPKNAWVSGASWYCNGGYKKIDNSCQPFQIPENSTASGSMWYCNQGYQKIQNQCVQMSEGEVAKQRQAFAELKASNSDGTIAYVTKVDSESNGVVKLENGAIVEISGYIGYVGYRKNSVLYGGGSRCNLWIAGKKSYRCELLKQPDDRPIEAKLMSLNKVRGQGSILVMDDGSIWEVDSFDTIETGIWLGISDGLLLGGSRYVNFDADELVGVVRID